MAQQTINVGTAPNDGTGTPLRTAFQYTNSNFSELYTAVGPSGNNIVVPGNATITGALTANGNISMANATSIFSSGAVALYVDTNQLVLRARATNGILFQESTGVNNLLTISNAGVFGFLDGAGGTRMTLNSTGLGVGASPSHRLTVSGTAATNTTGLGLIGTTTGYNRVLINNTSGGGQFGVEGSSGGNLCVGSTAYSTVVGSYQNYSLHFITNNNVQATIDTSGNVGIGVTPSAWGSNYKVVQVGQAGAVYGSAPTGFYGTKFNIYNDNTNDISITNNFVGEYRFNILNGSHIWFNKSTSSGGIGVNQTLTQAMTLDASGRLLVGTTSTLIAADVRLHVEGSQGIVAKSTGGFAYYPFVAWNTATSGDNVFSAFGTEATYTARGSISYNRAGGLVAYNTTSDYRAKDIIGPVSNSGSLIDSLKVYVGKMKGATIERPMLIAHEAQVVAPYAVTGTKDEVDADGKPKYQQMDASALVPLLIAEIQSLRARVQTLETR